MTAATRAVLRHAFERLPIIRLESHVMLPNTGSARVLEKAGFVHEATLRDWYLARDGSLYDALVYRMLRSEIPAEDSHVRRSS